jgi:hypothetical protein
VPRELHGAETETLPKASVERLKERYITVGELAKNIGWKG